MKKRHVLLCLTLLSLSVAAAPAYSLLVDTAQTATLRNYPNADSVLIDDQTLLRYEPDGTYRYVSDMAFKVLTEKGRQEHQTVRIGYDAAYGISRFELAEVIRPDGTVLPIDLDAQVRDAVSSGQMDANIYDPNHRTVRLSVPELEPGDILRYVVRGERNKTVVPDSWSDLFVLEETMPILHTVYQVDAPKSMPLTRIELKDPIEDTVQFSEQEREDRILYTWEVSRVPQMIEEPKMPARHTVAQRVLVSTIPDWETLSKWYWELSLPRIESVNSAMRDKVTELTDGVTDRQEQIASIFRFVSQDIRYMGITIEDDAPGYEPHDVSLTFDNRYGVCRDKAALLVAMLRIAGFDAYPVLIYVGPKKDPEVPQPWFNHAITAVRNEDGSWQLMDPTNENTRDLLPAYLCNRSYLVAHPDGEPLRTSPVIPPEDNMLSIEIVGELNDRNEINAQALLSFEGINDTAYRGRLARLKPEEREPYFENRLKQALGSAVLTQLEIVPEDVRNTTVPLSVKLDFTVQNAAVVGEESALLRPPTLINHFGLFGALLGDGTGLDERRFPLHTQITCGITETLRLDLTAGSLRAQTLPAYQTVNTPQLFIRRAVSETNGQLIAHADLNLKTVEFSPDEYNQLKEDLKTAEQNARQRVILHNHGFPREADFAVLDEQVRYALYDKQNWARLHTVKKKVLTYAGKMECSDIKIHYNPALESITINYAQVTAPDGSIRELDPEKEVNLMDAGWAGDAPRYPAGKILVANLPGVEVGSVIEYQILSISKQQPFFSAIETFAGHNPIAQKTVLLEAPHSLRPSIKNLAPTQIRRRTSHNGNNSVYEWSVENQPMVRKEKNLPPSWTFKPALLLSSGQVEDYAKQLRRVLRTAAKPDKKIKELARNLTDGAKSRQEKINRIRSFTDRTVRLAGPDLSDLPLSAITPAAKTLADGYGNSTDRSVLLYALCDAAKLKPRFVLSSDLPQISDVGRDFMASLQQKPFNFVLVSVEDGKQTHYLGDSGRYAQPGTLHHDRNPAIDLSTGNAIAPKPYTTNSTITSFSMELGTNGMINLVKKQQFTGSDFETFHKRFAEFTPEELLREQQTLTSHLSQSAESIGAIKPDFQAGTLELSARLNNFAVRTGDRMYFTLPEGLGNLLNIDTDQRTGPFYIEEAIETSFIYDILLPDGWETDLLPESFEIELPYNAGKVTVYTQTRIGRLMIIQKASIRPTIIPANQFHLLRELTDRLIRPAAQTIMLRKH